MPVLEEPRLCNAPVCRAKVLPLLYQISSLIQTSSDMSQTLKIILDIMEHQLNVVRGMITLFNRITGKIFVHEALGLTDEELALGIYSPGEGITGRVVQTGETIIVSRISEEPAFLNRTRLQPRNGEDYSFLCVPIARGKKVLGTISAERIFDNPGALKQDAELLAVIAAMIAQEVEIYLMETEEKPVLERENKRLSEQLLKMNNPKAKSDHPGLIGSSGAMQEIYGLVEKVAKTKTTVLVLGESGVGKELVARAIHKASAENANSFISFNCAALPEALVESELFGHEKGAYTGATSLRVGRFEEANGGTLFLDEVGELSLPVQAKLLRVLQERSFERVGGSRPIPVDLRVIAATNRNLEDMVKEGTFRSDLYYRLNVFPIVIPPLRERGSDIITLADHFVFRANQRSDKSIKRISTPALEMLLSYSWPGNVRELENVIERAVILSDDEVIHGYHLPPSLQSSLRSGTKATGPLEERLDALEYEMLVESLKACQGNMTQAAKELGLTKRIMGLRLKKFDLDYRKFRRQVVENKEGVPVLSR